VSNARPQLRSLAVADPPEAWSELGFRVSDGELELGGIRIRLGQPGRGIVGWTVSGLAEVPDLAGLAADSEAEPVLRQTRSHPNGAIGLDHLVLISPEFDRTAAELARAGLKLSRITDQLRGVRQGFRRLGPAILELVEMAEAPRVRLWGLTVIVSDLEALAARLGDRVSPVKPAIQPGRRISALRLSAGLTAAMAFMDPQDGAGSS
jgi:hypothetical protein